MANLLEQVLQRRQAVAGEQPIGIWQCWRDAGLRGPRGTGLLYVRRSVLERLEPPFVDLHAAEWVSRDRLVLRPDARRFENWETNYAGTVGLGVAIDYALSWGLDHIWARITALASMLRERLNALPGVTVRDPGVERCGIVSGSSTLNRGHEHQRLIRRCNAREGRPRCFGGTQRGSGT